MATTPFRRLQSTDLKDPRAMEQYIRGLERSVEELQRAVDDSRSRPNDRADSELSPDELLDIKSALEAGGLAQLDLTNLPGITAEPGDARIPRLTAHPDPYQTAYDTYVLIGSAGAADTLWQITRDVNPPVAVQIGFTTGYMTLDTPQTVIAAGIKTIDALWIFRVSQSISATFIGVLQLLIKNLDTGTGSSAELQIESDAGKLETNVYSAANVATALGITLSGYASVLASSGLAGLVQATLGNTPMVLGTNNVERMRLLGAGGAAGLTLTVGELIQMVGAIGAGTTQFEIKKSTADGGASVYLVDYEGDQTNRTLKLVGAVADTLLIQPASASGGAKLFVIKDTGAVEAVAMRDTGQVNLTGAGAGVIADSSTGGAAVFEVKLSGVQKAAIDSDGWMAGTALTVGSSGTKLTQIRAYAPSLTPVAVAANTTAEQIFAVAGVTTSDTLTLPNKPTAQAGLGIVGIRVSSAGNIGITFSNNTAGAITPTVAETYKFLAFRS